MGREGEDAACAGKGTGAGADSGGGVKPGCAAITHGTVFWIAKEHAADALALLDHREKV